MSAKSPGGGGIGFFGALGLLFIYMKLSGHISWPWWQVLSPIWGPPAFFLAIFCFMAIATVVLMLLAGCCDLVVLGVKRLKRALDGFAESQP